MTTPGRGARIKASPRARRAMARLGVDPHSVHGSGPNGRIVEADVVRYRPPAATTPIPAIAGQAREPSKRRRAIARLTSASCATVPHFFLRSEIDASALVQFKGQFPVSGDAAAGKLSFTDLLLRALALALRDCPWANTVWHNDTLVALPLPAVGLVVNLDDGLLIPVVDGADQLSLGELARRRAALVTAARQGKLSAEASRAVAASLSNLGHTRVDEFAPVLAPPQSSMLTVGRIAPRPFVVDGNVCARPTLRLCLAVDHRVLDGEPAARFLGQIIGYLEQPGRMLNP
jgi:pyruvate dehydrogenase E2 component (dihydrolipoamide acetyltransferase)